MQRDPLKTEDGSHICLRSWWWLSCIRVGYQDRFKMYSYYRMYSSYRHWEGIKKTTVALNIWLWGKLAERSLKVLHVTRLNTTHAPNVIEDNSFMRVDDFYEYCNTTWFIFINSVRQTDSSSRFMYILAGGVF